MARARSRKRRRVLITKRATIEVRRGVVSYRWVEGQHASRPIEERPVNAKSSWRKGDRAERCRR